MLYLNLHIYIYFVHTLFILYYTEEEKKTTTYYYIHLYTHTLTFYTRKTVKHTYVRKSSDEE